MDAPFEPARAAVHAIAVIKTKDARQPTRCVRDTAMTLLHISCVMSVCPWQLIVNHDFGLALPPFDSAVYYFISSMRLVCSKFPTRSRYM